MDGDCCTKMLRLFVSAYFLCVVSCHDNIDAKLNSMDRKLDIIEQKFDKKLDTIQQKVEEIAAALIDSQLNSMDRKLDIIEQKFDKKLDTIQQKVEEIAAALIDSQNPTQNPGKAVDNKVSPPKEDNTIVPLLASREVVDDGYKCTVRFSATGEHVEVDWWNLQEAFTIEPAEGKTLQHLMDDVWESSIVLPSSGGDRKVPSVHVNIKTADYDEVTETYTKITDMILQFSIRKTGDVIQTNFSVPFLKVEPAGDLVYNVGEDVEFKVTTNITNEDEQSLTMVYVDPDSQEFIFSFMPKEEMFELLSKEEEGNMYVLHKKIKTSEFPISGFLYFKTYQYTYDTLVHTVEVSRTRTIRPANQLGPIPSHYLNFYKNDFQAYVGPQTDGSVVCSRGMRCVITCVAVGENITSVSLHLPGQESFPLIGHNNLFTDSIYEGGSAIVSEDSSDVDGKVYQCRAENSYGMVISKRINVSVIVETRIVRDQSTAKLVDEDANLKALEITCTAMGTPPPALTINVNRDTSYMDDSPPVTEVYLNDYTVIASTRIIYNPSDPYESEGSHLAKPISVNCVANGPSNTTIFDDYYSIPLPNNL